MPVVAFLLLIWALFSSAVVVMMVYGAFDHVALNDAVMAAILATGTAFLASLAAAPVMAAQPAAGRGPMMTTAYGLPCSVRIPRGGRLAGGRRGSAGMAGLWRQPRRRPLHPAHPDHRAERPAGCRRLGSIAPAIIRRAPRAVAPRPLRRRRSWRNDALFFCTPYNRVIALQAETGKLLWSHEPDPKLDRAYDKQHSLICRGVSYWQEATPDPAKPCQSRIYQGVLDGRLEALDARTGALCADFASAARST